MGRPAGTARCLSEHDDFVEQNPISSPGAHFRAAGPRLGTASYFSENLILFSETTLPLQGLISEPRARVQEHLFAYVSENEDFV